MERYIHAGSNTSGELGIRNNINTSEFKKAKTEAEDLSSIISVGRGNGEIENIITTAIHEGGRVYACRSKHIWRTSEMEPMKIQTISKK